MWKKIIYIIVLTEMFYLVEKYIYIMYMKVGHCSTIYFPSNEIVHIKENPP